MWQNIVYENGLETFCVSLLVFLWLFFLYTTTACSNITNEHLLEKIQYKYYIITSLLFVVYITIWCGYIIWSVFFHGHKFLTKVNTKCTGTWDQGGPGGAGPP